MRDASFSVEAGELVALMALVLLGPRRLLPWALRALPLFALLRRG